MYGTLDISASGLVAQRTRMDAIAANLANAGEPFDPKSGEAPFQRRIVMLAAGDPISGKADGVHVESIELDDSPPARKFEPRSPYADADGYVQYSNVNPVIEQMNAMEAGRSYEANISAIEATKSMVSVALRIIA